MQAGGGGMALTLLRRTLLTLLATISSLAHGSDFRLDAAELAIADSDVKISAKASPGQRWHDIRLVVGGTSYEPISVSDSTITFPPLRMSSSGTHSIKLMRGEVALTERSIRIIPGWFTVVPPALAIVVALHFRSAIPALFIGVAVGAWGVIGFTPGGLLLAVASTFEVYIKDSLLHPEHATVILFTFMTAGMIGILARNGGMSGLVRMLTRWAFTPRRGMLCSAGLGFAIFFDDYATTLLVGKAMRPITDRLKVSREKLAYIVDSTAAPLACIAFVTTWVGFQLSLISNSVVDLPGLNVTASSMLISAISYSFYPILALAFVIMIAASGRDFGPMYVAEKSARERREIDDLSALPGQVETSQPDSGRRIPHRTVNFIVPIVVLVVTLLGGLVYTGEGDALIEVIGSADAFKALMWASFAGAATAGLMTLAQGILSLEETVQAWYAGVQTMLYAMIILLLAWSLSTITQELHTAEFLVSIIGDQLAPSLLPAVVFVFAALIAFATGSSFSTMGIMIPLVIPLVWGLLLANDQGNPDHYFIMYSSVASVMAGAVWGDHCSPISDTTILSSMSSDCDLIEHVKTQLPYAVCVGAVAVLLGSIPSGLGMPVWICLSLSAGALWVLLRFLGKKTGNKAVQRQ